MLQRKCFLLIQGEPTYANLYVALVGPPGVGKTRAIRMGKDILSQLKDFRLSPDALTREKLIDNLANSTKVSYDANGKLTTQTAYACFLDELSTFIRQRDYDMMTALTAFFDNPKTWEYSTLSRGSQTIENLFLTFIGGITPKSIQANWGENSIGLGFTSRLNFVYSEESKPIDLFGVKTQPDFSTLVSDIQSIYELHGQFQVTADAANTLQTWVSEGMPPIPADPRFAEANTRRSLHLVKLCMLFSVSDSNNLIIETKHVKRAKETLLEAEEMLPLVFEHMGQNPLLAALNNVHKWLKIEFGVSREPIIEARIRRKLMADVPPQYVEVALQELVNSGLCTVQPSSKGRLFTPVMTRTAVDDV